ncbi:hypothetical protein NHQ30_009286 [Ciborinia camelliae]|nr:hypothetical protein NHQ30_009286 [Ciborinia camelliae]
MNRVSPQLITTTYQTIKPLTSLVGASQGNRFCQIHTPKMLTTRSITTHTRSKSHSNKGRSFWQFYFQNYSNFGFKPIEQGSKVSKSGQEISTSNFATEKFEDNSNINTRNHAYYEKYSIAGFYPFALAHEAQSLLVKNVSKVKIEKKKDEAEDNRPIKTCSHAYYEKYSIAGFKPISQVPILTKVIKKDPSTNVESQEEEIDDGDTDPYDHAYYKNYSIAGFNPIETTTPKHLEPSKKLADMDPEVRKANALSAATVYTPSPPPQNRIKEEDLNIKHDIDTCAQTIESLEWEALGITRFPGARDDIEEGDSKLAVEKGKDDEEIVRFTEGDDGATRAGLPPICLFMGIF